MDKDNSPVVLVCVTNQRDCLRLIEVGVKISDTIDNSRVCVFNVQPIKAASEKTGEALEYLRQKSMENAADMMIVFDDDASSATANYASSSGTVQIVTGIAGSTTSGFIERLRVKIPNVIISMVAKDGVVHNLYPKNYCPYDNPVRKI